jgi:hypothetical protein
MALAVRSKDAITVDLAARSEIVNPISEIKKRGCPFGQPLNS